LSQVDRVIDGLVTGRYVLDRDRAALRDRAAAHWDEVTRR
jgi:hypothetical protein